MYCAYGLMFQKEEFVKAIQLLGRTRLPFPTRNNAINALNKYGRAETPTEHTENCVASSLKFLVCIHSALKLSLVNSESL